MNGLLLLNALLVFKFTRNEENETLKVLSFSALATSQQLKCSKKSWLPCLMRNKSTI